MAKDVLLACLHGTRVGLLERDDVGKMSFTYDSGVTTSISLHLPATQTHFEHKSCEAYFGGLLPEAEHARKLIARKFNADPDSTFSLLKAIGRDCAGAISLYEPSDLPTEPDEFQIVDGREIKEKELAQNIRDLHKAPLFSNIKGMRLSLAGVQDKAAVCVIENAICIPAPGVPTTHILKAAIEKLESSVQNEYLCLSIATNLGIPAAAVEMRRAEDQTYLLIKRHDREVTRDGRIRRVHQEDFCQALGLREKYQSEGGPGFKQCFNLMLQSEKPAVDRTTLVRMLILNYLLGNADAHGKNFSLLHSEPNASRLAQMYDVLSVAVYDGLEQRMAMSIGGSYDTSQIKPDHWRELCQEIGFGYSAFRKELSVMVERIMEAAEVERQTLKGSDFETWLADDIVRLLQGNCNRVKESFDWETA